MQGLPILEGRRLLRRLRFLVSKLLKFIVYLTLYLAALIFTFFIISLITDYQISLHYFFAEKGFYVPWLVDWSFNRINAATIHLKQNGINYLGWYLLAIGLFLSATEIIAIKWQADQYDGIRVRALQAMKITGLVFSIGFLISFILSFFVIYFSSSSLSRREIVRVDLIPLVSDIRGIIDFGISLIRVEFTAKATIFFTNNELSWRYHAVH